MSRRERQGCGCALLALGAPTALVAYLFAGLAESYGTDYWWQKVIIWAVLLAAVAAVVAGIVLIVQKSKR